MPIMEGFGVHGRQSVQTTPCLVSQGEAAKSFQIRCIAAIAGLNQIEFGLRFEQTSGQNGDLTGRNAGGTMIKADANKMILEAPYPIKEEIGICKQWRSLKTWQSDLLTGPHGILKGALPRHGDRLAVLQFQRRSSIVTAANGRDILADRKEFTQIEEVFDHLHDTAGCAVHVAQGNADGAWSESGQFIRKESFRRRNRDLDFAFDLDQRGANDPALNGDCTTRLFDNIELDILIFLPGLDGTEVEEKMAPTREAAITPVVRFHPDERRFGGNTLQDRIHILTRFPTLNIDVNG